MPPRRSTTITKSKVTKKKKSTTPRGRARPGEKLLVTCAPIVTDYMMRDLADTLYGSFFSDEQGYWRIAEVRIDERARKIYGKCQAQYEAAPYMFMPLP